MAEPYSPANTWHGAVTVYEDGDVADAAHLNVPLKQLADNCKALAAVDSTTATTLTALLEAVRDQVFVSWNMQAHIRSFVDRVTVSGEQPQALVSNLVLATGDYGANIAVVALFSGGKVRATKDLVVWDIITTGSGYSALWRGGIYAHGRLILYGEAGEIHTLLPTATSSVRRKTSGADILGMVNNATNDRLVAIDASGVVWRDVGLSTGQTWESVGDKFAGTGDGAFLAAGFAGATPIVVATWHSPDTDANLVYRSTDNGTTWTSHAIDPSTTVRAVRPVYTNIPGKPWVVLAMGADYYLYTSTDGITWTRSVTLPKTFYTYSVYPLVLDGALLVLSDTQAAHYDGSAVLGLEPVADLPARAYAAAYVSVPALNANYVMWCGETAVHSVVWPSVK